MKLLLISMMTLFSFLANAQSTDMLTAQSTAKENHKLILLEFSGSDWCIPCIRMEKQVFEKEAFTNYASDHLVLMRADFPRLKKNQLSKDQAKRNEDLAEKYNRQGAFPHTVLLDPDGKVLKEWDGLVAVTPEEFIKQLQPFTGANN